MNKDYGKIPIIDYQSWKHDPRAYKIIDITSEHDGNCAVSDDKLLIECWMGYKWGFYKFSVEPVLNATQIETNWRPVQPKFFASTTKKPSNVLLKSIVIELTKLLKEQLERLKQHVIIAQRRLKNRGAFSLIL